MRVQSYFGLQRLIQLSSTKMTRALMQLAEQKRILSPADDPAGFAVVQKLKSELKSLETANQSNIPQAESLIDTAGSAAQLIREKLDELEALATEGDNPTLTTEQREELDVQYQSILEDIDSLAQDTAFNGINLLDGSLNIKILVGLQSESQKTLEFGDLGVAAIELAGTNLLTENDSETALKYLSVAKSKVDLVLSRINAADKSLDFRKEANDKQIENLTEGIEVLEGIDPAEAAANLAVWKTLNESQVALLSSSLDYQSDVFALLWSRK